MMQIVDLFSGIGGFSLAGHWLGWRTIQFCDINPFGKRVVEYHFPGVPYCKDIKTLTGEQIKNNGLYDPNETSIMVGGFPCQPYSMAGKRAGTDDDRHLWPECIRLVREFRPDFCVWENVPGLINWSGGMVFEQVCLDLEGEGYEVQPVVLPASGVNAPHRRDRVWFVARRNVADTTSSSAGSSRSSGGLDNEWSGDINEPKERRTKAELDPGRCDILPSQRPIQNPNEDGRGGDERVRTDHAEIGANANTSSSGRKELIASDFANGQRHSTRSNPTDWTDWPTVAPLCSRNDGLPSRLDGITFPKWRNESIKAGGNAVVVPLVYQIFKTIEAYETSIQTEKD